MVSVLPIHVQCSVHVESPTHTRMPQASAQDCRGGNLKARRTGASEQARLGCNDAHRIRDHCVRKGARAACLGKARDVGTSDKQDFDLQQNHGERASRTSISIGLKSVQMPSGEIHELRHVAGGG